MSEATQERRPIELGALQVAIAVCILATTLIHLYTAAIPDTDLRLWFLLAGLGYLGLGIAFFLPRLASRHHTISFILAGYAILTIILWFVLDQPDLLVGCVTNAIAFVLAGMAVYEGWRARRLRAVAVV